MIFSAGPKELNFLVLCLGSKNQTKQYKWNNHQYTNREKDVAVIPKKSIKSV